MRKFMFVEMDDGRGYWDIYEIKGSEIDYVTDIELDDLPNYLESFRTLDFDVTIRTYKSFDLLYESHLKSNDDECESLMGGLYYGLEDPYGTGCVVCDQRLKDVEDYSKKVGVKQNV